MNVVDQIIQASCLMSGKTFLSGLSWVRQNVRNYFVSSLSLYLSQNRAMLCADRTLIIMIAQVPLHLSHITNKHQLTMKTRSMGYNI